MGICIYFAEALTAVAILHALEVRVWLWQLTEILSTALPTRWSTVSLLSWTFVGLLFWSYLYLVYYRMVQLLLKRMELIEPHRSLLVETFWKSGFLCCSVTYFIVKFILDHGTNVDVWLPELVKQNIFYGNDPITPCSKKYFGLYCAFYVHDMWMTTSRRGFNLASATKLFFYLFVLATQLMSLRNPQIRPIIEQMMRDIRPAEEVQRTRRIVAMSKMKQKSDTQKTSSEDEKRAELERKYKALKAEVQEKRAKELAQKNRIESLKKEIEQKHRRASKLQHEIGELNKLTKTVTGVSKQLVKKSKKMCDSNCVTSYSENVAQEQLSPPSEAASIVCKFTEEQEKAITNLTMSRISAPPESTTDMGWHMELFELQVQNVAKKKQLEEYNSKLEVAVEGLVQRTMNTLSDSINKEIVKEWAELQAKEVRNETLYKSLQDLISTRSNSSRCDRDFNRVVLIHAERKLNALEERSKSVQKELLQSAKELSHGWLKIEEAAEKARRKRSQLEVESKEAEMTGKLRFAIAVELKTLHDAMPPLMKTEPTIQEVLKFGTTYNDLFYILKLAAEKRMARHVVLSLPKIFALTEDPRVEQLISMNSDETSELEGRGKSSNISELTTQVDLLLSNNDRLIQSVRDLIAMWEVRMAPHPSAKKRPASILKTSSSKKFPSSSKGTSPRGKGSARKMPDISSIRKAQFEKMESFVDFSQRRHKCVRKLDAQAVDDDDNNKQAQLKPSAVAKPIKQTGNALSRNPVVSRNTSRPGTPRALSSSCIPAATFHVLKEKNFDACHNVPHAVNSRPSFTKMGNNSRPTPVSNTKPQRITYEQAKTIIQSKKPLAAVKRETERLENRNILKGVRLNRRFELQMHTENKYVVIIVN